MNNQQQTLTNESALHKYFHMIPNMADEDLTLYEYRLYGHYIRICGGGNTCTEGVRATAKVTQMGYEKVIDARTSLAQKGFIRTNVPNAVAARKGKTVHVTLIDRWEDNIHRYAKGVSNSEQGVSENEQVAGEGVSDSERINNKRINNNTQDLKTPPYPPEGGNASADEKEPFVSSPNKNDETADSESKSGEVDPPTPSASKESTDTANQNPYPSSAAPFPVGDWIGKRVSLTSVPRLAAPGGIIQCGATGTVVVNEFVDEVKSGFIKVMWDCLPPENNCYIVAYETLELVGEAHQDDAANFAPEVVQSPAQKLTPPLKKERKQVKSPKLTKARREAAAFKVEWEVHHVWVVELMKSMGLDVEFTRPEDKTMTVKKDYLAAAKELFFARFKVGDIPNIGAFMHEETKHWSKGVKPSLKTFLTKADEWRSKQSAPTTRDVNGRVTLPESYSFDALTPEQQEESRRQEAELTAQLPSLEELRELWCVTEPKAKPQSTQPISTPVT